MKPVTVSNNIVSNNKVHPNSVLSNDDGWFKHMLHSHLAFKAEYNCMWDKQEVKSPTQLLKTMGIEKVIFNKDATIVYLSTGEKGVAKRSKDDEFDPVIGLSVAYAMAEGTRGNKSQFKKLVNKLYSKQNK